MTNVEPQVPVESRRSTRVRLKVLIEAQGIAEPLTCQGETIVVNRHGALISTAVALRVGMRIEESVSLRQTNMLPPTLSTSILISLVCVESGY